MKTTRKLNDFILIQCLLMYHFIQQYHVAYARCSWGSWLSWNCSCCGNSYDIQVFRVRAKCCNHTHECPVRRMSSSDISDENKFEEKSSCMKDCGKLFSNYNPHTCTSSKMSLNEITEQSKIKSCKATCLGKILGHVCTTILKMFDILYHIKSTHVVNIIIFKIFSVNSVV
jgi:hypothetical protein